MSTSVLSAPAPTASPSAAPTTETAPDVCTAAEVTGAPPEEAICRRPRKAAASRCCEGPVDVVVLGASGPLLKLEACTFVPPDCGDVHGHGNMDARLRVLEGTPPQVVFVEGGCEARALAHGYVPPGVAAWSGCRHVRYQWDGVRLEKVAKP